MAHASSRFITRTTNNSSLKSFIKTSFISTSSSPHFPLPAKSSISSPLRRFSVSRTPSGLGCAMSLLPLHSAVAAARMTSCLSSSTSCRALSQVLGLSGPR